MSDVLEKIKASGQESEVSAEKGGAKPATSDIGPAPVLEYSEIPEPAMSADVPTAEKTETSVAAATVATAPPTIASADAQSVDAPPAEKAETSVAATPSVRESISVKPKKKRGGVVLLVALIVLAGLGTAAYRFGLLSDLVSFDGLRVQNVTELPEGAVVPAFAPIDPAIFSEIVEDELVVVPDETGLPLVPDDGAVVVSTSKNYYTQTPNVSGFYTRAMQDEGYVYFLKHQPEADSLSDLMRMKISTGKAEPVSNANEVSESIYSFTLWGQNIITCEYKRNTQTYAFYRVPKGFADAQVLFEQDSPAYMNVHDNKIFMLFASSQKLGVFDPDKDTQPAFIDMPIDDEAARYLPEFSVTNGYLYYGVAYDEDERTEYFRRSLYTGETVKLLDSAGGTRIVSPCWDGEGGAYYGQAETGTYQLMVSKSGTTPEALSSFRLDGYISPPIVLKDEFLVASASSDTLCRFGREDLLLKDEISVSEVPYATTRDFLIASDGVYRLFDFSFMPFDS